MLLDGATFEDQNTESIVRTFWCLQMFEVRPMKPDVMSSQCSSRRYLATLTSKWAILIVNALGHGPLRNGELLRAVEGISQKMLTQTLQELAALNIVQRDDKKTIPPHVEYKLTVLGHSFKKEANSLIRWVEASVPLMSERTRRRTTS
jgi:DNA-binding HxlR family transcriptional regulator